MNAKFFKNFAGQNVILIKIQLKQLKWNLVFTFYLFFKSNETSGCCTDFSLEYVSIQTYHHVAATAFLPKHFLPPLCPVICCRVRGPYRMNEKVWPTEVGDAHFCDESAIVRRPHASLALAIQKSKSQL